MIKSKRKFSFIISFVFVAGGLFLRESLAFGPIQPGDSLWKISGEVYRHDGVTRDQAMLALLKANPGAVESPCNVNAPLRVGVPLQVPSAAAAKLLPAAEARRAVEQQMREWKEHVRTGQPLACAPAKPTAAASVAVARKPPVPPVAPSAEAASPPTQPVVPSSPSKAEPEHVAAAKTAVAPPVPEVAPKPDQPKKAVSANTPPQSSAPQLTPVAAQTSAGRPAPIPGKHVFLVWLGVSMVLAMLAVALARKYSVGV
jgi:FimV-like protein